jgi:tetratricopeptide (TPR) repeat protein
MKKLIIPLIISVAILTISIFLVNDYLDLWSHPRVEAHRFLDQKTIAAVTYEWIPYYYRHPRPQETVEVIKVILSQGKTDPARMVALNHFFATILHQHQEELAKLQAERKKYSGKQLARLTAIIKETANYQPVKEVAPESIEPLWAEYMVTGDTKIIARMVQAVEPPRSYADQSLFNAIQDGFFRHLPAYLDAFRAFDAACKNNPEVLEGFHRKMRRLISKTFGEPANMHLERADNYLKQHQYRRALDEFEKALEYYPDYVSVFINVANMYESQGKLSKAMAAMEKAVQIDPTRPSACYGRGRHLAMQGKHEEAIKWYSQALSYRPKNRMYVHAIARSYQSQGDTANAVKYFQQYLQYAPNGEHADLVKRYLASVNVPVAAANPIFAAFKKKDYQSLEMQLATILKEKKKDQDGYSLLSKAYDQICHNPDAKNSMEKWLGDFEDWLRSDPSSHFANAAIGIFYVDYAWHARGSGWANTVTEEGYRLFKERLLKARNYLEKAYIADYSDPVVPSGLIKVALGLGSDYAEMEKQFQRAIKADRSAYEAYGAKFTFLMPKWHGSREEMFSFARETARNAPADSLAPLVLAKAHWEMYARSEDRASYFQQPEVWNEVRSVYSLLCDRFPKSKERHYWFARTARLAGDFETAKRESAIIQNH